MSDAWEEGEEGEEEWGWQEEECQGGQGGGRRRGSDCDRWDSDPGHDPPAVGGGGGAHAGGDGPGEGGEELLPGNTHTTPPIKTPLSYPLSILISHKGRLFFLYF